MRVRNAETLRELIGTKQQHLILCVDDDNQSIAKATHDGFQESVTVNDSDRAAVVGEVLESWIRDPTPDFFSDSKRLVEWVHLAREKCRLAGSEGIGSDRIGDLLAKSPADTDGVWPTKSVRRIIEDAGSDDLDDGIRRGYHNSRGWQSREGSHAERVLAAKFRNGERQLKIGWPRTTRLLRRLADDFEAEARSWDRHDEKRRFR